MKKSLIYFSLVIQSFLMTACSNNNYPAEVKGAFIKSCMTTSENNTKMCNCSFEKTKEKYSYESFMKIDLAMRQGKIDPATIQNFIEIRNSCM